MSTIELLMLIQTVTLLLTGVIVAFYTWETRKMRAVATGQFQIMRQTLQLQFEEQKRAYEPVFVWAGGSSGLGKVERQFRNEGGPITYLTVTMNSATGAPTNIVATIAPTEWLGSGDSATVQFSGDVEKQFTFTIGFRTRLGAVGGFFYTASRTSKPMLTGSGWV